MLTYDTKMLPIKMVSLVPTRFQPARAVAIGEDRNANRLLATRSDGGRGACRVYLPIEIDNPPTKAYTRGVAPSKTPSLR